MERAVAATADAGRETDEDVARAALGTMRREMMASDARAEALTRVRERCARWGWDGGARRADAATDAGDADDDDAGVSDAFAGFCGRVDDLGWVSRESRAKGVRAVVGDVRVHAARGEGRRGGRDGGDDAGEISVGFARARDHDAANATHL